MVIHLYFCNFVINAQNYSGLLYFYISRFARRLAEYFLISVTNRIERNEMDQLKAIQEKRNYRKILAKEYIKAIEDGLLRQGKNRRLGQVFLMPETFAGSRQFYQKKYAELMTIVRNLGNPTWYDFCFFLFSSFRFHLKSLKLKTVAQGYGLLI